MFTAVFTHQVEDFDTWFTEFENHSEIRRNFGATGAEVFQATDDPNKVTVLARFDSVDSFNRFASSDELKEAMTKGGVIAPPEVHTLNSVRAYDN